MIEPRPRWRVVGVHHVAFAHGPGSKVESALAGYLGLAATHEENGQGFTERMAPVGEDCYIQLLEATGDGIIDRFVSRRGSALHHVAFEVLDIDEALASLTYEGARLIDTQPRTGGMGTRIAFVHPSSFDGLLVELVEVTHPA